MCLLVKDDYPHGGLLVFFLIHIAIFLLLNHDLELCSSSFTFGRTRASSILLSLNHDNFTILCIQSFLRRLATELPTVEGVPRVAGTIHYPLSTINNINSRGIAVVAEVDVKRRQLSGECFAVTNLEVGFFRVVRDVYQRERAWYLYAIHRKTKKSMPLAPLFGLNV